MQELGVVSFYSRLRASNENPYSECFDYMYIGLRTTFSCLSIRTYDVIQ
jgi:hypothetical protein